MYLKNLLAISLLAALMFSSCKKDEKGDTIFFSNGSVTGTIKGTKADNSVLDETFTWNKYTQIADMPYYKVDPNEVLFNVYFNDEAGNEFSLQFFLSSLTDNTPGGIHFELTYYKTTDNSIYRFETWSSGNTAQLSDFSFDSATGKLKCKLDVSGTNNSTGKNATVTANIDVTLKKLEE
ncbi:MAG TPA: hypothetical protein VHO72_09735 [Bacteroidales bacterium]|nr:hypothetical protein [Bacteroidales bacterium]